MGKRKRRCKRVITVPGKLDEDVPDSLLCSNSTDRVVSEARKQFHGDMRQSIV